jgi:outer membrane murein-binding lipoprotein Lpp
MYMRILCIFALVFCLTTSGCISPRYSDRSSREELRKSKASIDQINEQMSALNKELEALKKDLQQIKEVKQKEEAKAITEEESLTDQEAPVKEKHGAIKEKSEEVSVPELKKKKQIQEADISKKDETTETPDKKPALQRKLIDLKTYKIKVLSGNGKLVPARDMSKKLIGMGYKIEDIGIAARTDFRENTIYYASNYQKEAEQLEARLGGDTVSRPLTWTSVYHIIVVAVP